ncbi:MAG TPA: hypothetical protein VMS11_01485 [Solirubrobacterales bacterium]|nr:hypothetical protein [Solirubrobacterales bacterium]
MPEPPKEVTLHLPDSIVDCPTSGTSMNLPIAVLRRLDAMASEGRFVRASRNELLAALIASASVDAASLADLVSTYRQLRIADVLPDEALPDATNSDSVVVPLRQRGRPGGKSRDDQRGSSR